MHRLRILVFARRIARRDVKQISTSTKFLKSSVDAELKKSFAEVPSLKDFIRQSSMKNSQSDSGFDVVGAPYLKEEHYAGNNRRVFIEVYGCQMNESDTDIAWSILHKSGFQRVYNIRDADVILVMTCSIREGAEQKIWKRLEFLKSLKKLRSKEPQLPPLKIGILGCMAERLKNRIVEVEKMVDVVCGPDAYRALPQMLALTESGQSAVNVLLSLDETYADIMPVHSNTASKSAFVSIMRGCDNMCSYCIVPFTRGRERSRPIHSILEEVRQLSDQGFKEIVLLGQNVNSYRDCSTTDFSMVLDTPVKASESLSQGFRTVYRPRVGGRRFSDLLHAVAAINRDIRIRFTSPHPKDFPDEVLQLIRDEPNICRQIHLPAQSGSTRVLDSMRRGYTSEAYLELVHHIRRTIPGVALSSDFIAGFCGETEEDHLQTLSLIKTVKYNFVFCFPYSMRQKTMASHRLNDDVPEDVKYRRHDELTAAFRECSEQLNRSLIGCHQVVLIEGDSKRSDASVAGRTEANTRVIIPKIDIPSVKQSSTLKPMQPGDYVTVEVTGATSQVLKGNALHHTSVTGSTL